MGILIILIIITAIGLYLQEKLYDNFSDFLFATGIILLSLNIMISGIWALNSYLIEADRQAIVETIKVVSTDGEFEHLSLDAEILEFNKGLRQFQLANDNWFWFWGINDIVDELEPITDYRKGE